MIFSDRIANGSTFMANRFKINGVRVRNGNG
ncbi:hypothetical protein, partial [Bacillus thuringiensis]